MIDVQRLIVIVGLAFAAEVVVAVDHVTLKRDGTTTRLEGKVLVEAQDGGLVLQTADGVMWFVDSEELGARSQDDKPFVPLNADQAANEALQELGRTFRVHRTLNYVICYDTSSAYAQWCGALYERLFKAFYTYWDNRGVELDDPSFPLVAFVFKDKPTFARF